MKRVRLKDHVYRAGEYIVGAEATGSHACYLLYGVLSNGESRDISPGRGHEEIVCVVEGEATARAGDEEFALGKGDCLFLAGDETVRVSSSGGYVIYVVAGGHTPGGHAHHEGAHGH